MSGGGDVAPAGGPDAAFEFTAVAPNYAATGTAALNDVLRLTGAAPFDGSSLTSANVIDIYLTRLTVNYGDVFEVGFYAEQFTPAQLSAAVENATFVGWIRTEGAGRRTFGGVNYDPIDYNPALAGVRVTTKAGPGNVGAIPQIEAVPEPGSLALAGCGLAALAVVAVRRRLRRR